jgi:membrane protein implicated in regulation of membrane protease activity
MRDVKALIIAIEGGVLLLLGAASIVSGRFLGAAILVGLASLAAASAWALWPLVASREEPDGSLASLADDLVEQNGAGDRGVERTHLA